YPALGHPQCITDVATVVSVDVADLGVIERRYPARAQTHRVLRHEKRVSDTHRPGPVHVAAQDRHRRGAGRGRCGRRGRRRGPGRGRGGRCRGGGGGRLRWRVAGGGQSVPPLSSAGLPATSACVNVGPPLLASGASAGSVLMMSPDPIQRHVCPLGQLLLTVLPRLSLHVVPEGQSVGTMHSGSQLVPTSLLRPPDVKLVPKFWHASLGGSCAKMVYLNVTSPVL